MFLLFGHHTGSSSSSFKRVLSINYHAAIDLGAGVEQQFYSFVIQNRQAKRYMGRRWIGQ